MMRDVLSTGARHAFVRLESPLYYTWFRHAPLLQFLSVPTSSMSRASYIGTTSGQY